MNKTTFTGNLTADVEQGVMPSGTVVANFTVANHNKWTDKEGKQHKSVQYYRVSVTNRQAQPCIDYLYKGRGVTVDGHLLYDQHGNPKTYTTSTGETRASFDVRAHTVDFGADTDEFLVKKYGQAQAQPAGRGNTSVAAPVEQDADYIPF